PTITNISFGNQNSAVTTVTLTGTGTATLRLTVTNPDSCGNATDEIVLTVYSLPVCSITGDDTICSGETTEFCGPLGLSFYSWSGPNDFMSTDRCTGQISTAGVYTLTITDSNGCQSICQRTLTVNETPGAPSTTGDARCGPGVVHLSASGCDGGTLKWYDA